MSDIQITGLQINSNHRPTPRGNEILAYFNADVRGFSFIGCAFVRKSAGGLTAWLPRLEEERANRLRAVKFNDPTLPNALMRAARDMYIRMGGKGAEWKLEEPADEGERKAREFLSALHDELLDKGSATLTVRKESADRSDEPEIVRNRPPAIDLPTELPPAIVSMMDSRLGD
jgi:hypothetical protein